VKKDLVSISDLSHDEIEELINLGIHIKGNADRYSRAMERKTLAMVFEKPSLRTRVTFEAGMTQMGGHAVYLAPQDISLGVRESVPDVARNLSRWVDGVMARTFAHDTVVTLAENSSIPVINGLTDREHPCQVLAFAMTLFEKKGVLKGLRVAFIGDGNNVSQSMMLLCPKLGMDFVIACPEGYDPEPDILDEAIRLSDGAGTSVSIVRDPFEAARDADVIYTDVWASMGQESERDVRERAFRPYQVNLKLLESSGGDTLVSHCLPAHRGEEITDEVLDGPNSMAFDEAENRLHIQKAILVKLIG